MRIRKLEIFCNKNQINHEKNQEQNMPVSLPSRNFQNVTSPIAAQALKALAFAGINKQNYTFLQNINIPQLNLNANVYLLKNGQKCVIAKKSGPAVIKTYFKVGSMNEPDNLRGISHYIEHNLFNGSENLNSTEFVKKVNAMGATYNASTGFIATDYFIQSPLHAPTDLAKFIKMHADMISKPTFAQDMLDKEKGPVISEIQMLADNPNNSAINIALKNLFSIKTDSQDLIGGCVENIKNLTRADVLNFYNSHYTPKNAITFVVGDVDEKQTLELLSNNFAGFVRQEKLSKHSEKLNPIKKTVRQDSYSTNAQSSIINMAFAGPNNNVDKTATTMLLYALTGYKNAKLTEALKKHNIQINAGIEQISNVDNQPTAIIFSTTTPTDTEAVLKLMYEKIYEMSYKPLSDEELQLIKNKMKYQIKYSAESNFDLVHMLGAKFIQEKSFDSLVNFEKNIDAMTAQDIMLAARKYLDLNKVSLAVVHPQKGNQISFGSAKQKHLDIKVYKTPNNVEVSTLNSTSSNLYSLHFSLKSDLNSPKAPITSILTKMLSKGTSLMPEREFFDIEDRNNISSAISASKNSLGVSYSFPKESLNVVLDNLHKNVFSPALNKENFEKAKEEIKNLYLSKPKMAVHRAMEMLYEGSSKAYSLRKVFEELENVSFEDVVNYYNQFVSTASAKISLTGNLEDETIVANVFDEISKNGKIFSSSEANNNLNAKILEKDVVVTDVQKRNQADIVKAFKVKETGNIKDKVAILLLNEILGGGSNSRLFNDLREKQKLAYQVYSTYLPDNNNDGTFLLRILTTTESENNPQQYENLQKAINGFNSHVNNLLNNKVSEEELETAKLQLKSTLLFGAESTSGKNALLVKSMNSLYKDKYFENFFDAIDAMTADDIQAVAKYYLSKPSVTSVVASQSTIDKNKEYLASLGKHHSF